MKRKLRTSGKKRIRISTRLVYLVATASVSLVLVLGWLVYLNLDNLSKTRASTGQENGGSILNPNGEIISEFTWESDPVTSATLGPDAIHVSKDAHSGPGGRASTNGLSAGPNGKDINLEFKASELFNLEGIDISIDYRRSEADGNFFTRGNVFNFGIEQG